MIEKKITVGLPNGLEARQVAMFVQIAGQYNCSVNIEYKGRRVNAKSIMGMMSLGLAKGEELTVETDGADEDKAAAGLEAYLSGK
ncbi:MAG: HPr family phosphocarrier protein [Parasporobacterium sp.]|nr:HPr family phosphocarrier protein [Parasporobacterium sp.]